MIQLDRVSKTYPGSTAPAIEELSLDVRAGEIVVLVGPSGCGKTTTMRMINRLIEPTTGRVILDGDDVTNVNADELRRRIGYVIQQVGLLPHMTVASNIGLVPRALGWEKKRIRERVEELLDLVGLDPAMYRGRYPKQLSGGQQQRVGVARALAADPPVMLMDEPFGAIDPIVRDRLQDEFLALQQQIHKTVVFVTHDIQEAVKLGDRIAIFAEGGRIAQYDTPAQILANPADEFVSSFIGAGAAVRLLRLEQTGSMPLLPLDDALAEKHGRGEAAVVRADQSLYATLDAMLHAHDDVAVVVDGNGSVVGGLPWSTVLARAVDGVGSGPT
ncbi:ABC transporter ATP-binding protein [Solicola gregarius]|uniref:ABC-type quaternary amine transporter n=2 Tax=Solicola gregarius TaxID=2908642 RepID=A0AA46YMA0_9ACTN|nr:ABC transporter ATP-binding protein [Solicola gregarius]UYM07860.1 ABC transporter ATP-binding protein [Solicola gregarius]